MARRKARKVVSQAQARLFGAAAGGAKTKAPGLSAGEAKKKLKGLKVKRLPKRKGKR